MNQREVFAPRFGRILAVAAGVVAVGGVVLTGLAGHPLSAGPWLLVLAATWAVFWRPSVTVEPDALTFRNVFRDIRIPWGRVRDVETRYALTVTTDDGKRYAAWAAPAPGAMHGARVSRDRLQHLPESSYVDGTIRSGDDTATDSGVAALIVRRSLERHRESGSAGAETVTVQPAVTAIAACVAALVLAALSLLP